MLKSQSIRETHIKPHWGITSHLSEWLLSPRQKNKCSQEYGEKGTLVHCFWECKLIQSLMWKTVWSYLKKLKMELRHNTAIPLLGLHLKKTETLTWKATCTPVFRTVRQERQARSKDNLPFLGIRQKATPPPCSALRPGSMKEWHQKQKLCSISASNYGLRNYRVCTIKMTLYTFHMWCLTSGGNLRENSVYI